MRDHDARDRGHRQQKRPLQRRYWTYLGLTVAALLPCSLLVGGGDPPPVDYGRDILPILRDNCYQCHDGRKSRSGLRLDVRSQALRGGESGHTPVDAAAALLEKTLDKERRRIYDHRSELVPPKGRICHA